MLPVLRWRGCDTARGSMGAENPSETGGTGWEVLILYTHVPTPHSEVMERRVQNKTARPRSLKGLAGSFQEGKGRRNSARGLRSRSWKVMGVC